MGAIIAEDGPPWRGRAATRLALGFVLDIANLSRADGDLVEPLVFAAIVEANQVAFRTDPELARRFSREGDTLPDELRRPISVSAVAQSLGMSFETVRRKVRAMMARGTVVATPAGVYVPAAVIAGPRHAGVQRMRAGRIWDFHQALAAAGFFADGGGLSGRPPPALHRPVNRMLSQYVLRTYSRLGAMAGGVTEGFVLLGLWVAAGEAAAGASAGVSGVARRLAVPEETVRRHLKALAARGLAERAGRGWAPAVPKAHAAALAAWPAEDEAEVRRLFARLAEVGAGQPQP
jgi:DNA-binding Lrp family transcriptional regulator